MTSIQLLPNTAKKELKDAEQDIQRNAYNMNAWKKLLGYASAENQRSNIEHIRAIYEYFLSIFPTSGRQWKAYIEMENRFGNQDNVQLLFQRCLKKSTYLPLWQMYLNYLELQADIRPSEIIVAYETMLRHVGFDPQSSELWMSYIKFITQYGSRGSIELKRKTFQRGSCTPLEDGDDFLNEYEQWEEKLKKNGHAEGNNFDERYSDMEYNTTRRYVDVELKECKNRHAHAQSVLMRRGYLSTNLLFNALPQPPSEDSTEKIQVTLWRRLIAYEESNPLDLDPVTLRDRVSHVYRQALQPLYFFPELWISFAHYYTHIGLIDDADLIYREAEAALPSSPLVSYSRAEFLEHFGYTAQAQQVYLDLIERLKDSYSATKAKRVQVLERLNNVFITFQKFLRRTEGIGAARAWLVDCIRQLSDLRAQDRSSQDVPLKACISPLLFISAAEIEVHQNHDLDSAQAIFELGKDLCTSNDEFALAFANFFAIHRNDQSEARNVFEAFLTHAETTTRGSDDRLEKERLERLHRVFEAYLLFEAKTGNVDRSTEIQRRMNEALGLSHFSIPSLFQSVSSISSNFSSFAPFSLTPVHANLLSSQADSLGLQRKQPMLLQPFENRNRYKWQTDDQKGSGKTKVSQGSRIGEKFDPIFAVSLYSQAEAEAIQTSSIRVRHLSSSLSLLTPQLFDFRHPHFTPFQQWRASFYEAKRDESEAIVADIRMKLEIIEKQKEDHSEPLQIEEQGDREQDLRRMEQSHLGLAAMRQAQLQDLMSSVLVPPDIKRLVCLDIPPLPDLPRDDSGAVMEDSLRSSLSDILIKTQHTKLDPLPPYSFFPTSLYPPALAASLIPSVTPPSFLQPLLSALPSVDDFGGFSPCAEIVMIFVCSRQCCRGLHMAMNIVTVGPKLHKLPKIIYISILSFIALVGIAVIVLPVIVIAQAGAVRPILIILILVGVGILALVTIGFLALFLDYSVFPIIFFLASLVADVILFIASTICMVSPDTLKSALESIAASSGCTADSSLALCVFIQGMEGGLVAVGILMFLCSFLLLIVMAIDAYLLGIRKTATTSILFGFIISIVIGAVFIVFGVYLIIAVIKTSHWMIIVLVVIGAVIAAAGVIGLLGGVWKKLKSTLLLVLIVYFAVGGLSMLLGILQFINQNTSAIMFTNETISTICGFNCLKSETPNCGSESPAEGSYLVGCCAYLDISLDDGLCLKGRNNDYVEGRYIQKTKSTLFPTATMIFYISLFMLWVGFCVFFYRHKMDEWRLQDLQDAIAKKGGMLTEDELSTLSGKKVKKKVTYQPARGGSTIYVFDKLVKEKRSTDDEEGDSVKKKPKDEDDADSSSSESISDSDGDFIPGSLIPNYF
ncbi:putative Cleavage stimulation factor subunit 3 [Blattamonas nauphoetae]|uniref:Cleavage stimulation factor subunit 3 n=1 Tax=Blattamonas nauphoetae TaxID=2049346 RepID=A0ABQ9YF61_9EUKA|nr:putative Cleavage stimulation factor subunit 3 [Blattamonas nauphoetae]